MLSDEEKKAIDILINEIADIVISEYCTHCKICENEDTECYYTKVIDIVYNLVQKQSKEIEELKEKDDANLAYYDQIYQNGIYTGQKAVEYKIKAKIEEYENKIKKIRSKKLINEPEDTIIITRYAHYISVLQSLLEKE